MSDTNQNESVEKLTCGSVGSKYATEKIATHITIENFETIGKITTESKCEKNVSTEANTEACNISETSTETLNNKNIILKSSSFPSTSNELNEIKEIIESESTNELFSSQDERIPQSSSTNLANNKSNLNDAKNINKNKSHKKSTCDDKINTLLEGKDKGFIEKDILQKRSMSIIHHYEHLTENESLKHEKKGFENKKHTDCTETHVSTDAKTNVILRQKYHSTNKAVRFKIDEKSEKTGLKNMQSSNTCFLFKCMNSKAAYNQPYNPTDIEQIANVITHGFWILPSVYAFWFINSLATSREESIAVTIYASSIILLFSVSTIFHSIAFFVKKSQWRTFFHIGDRVVIYVFIASSYTPWLILKEYHRLGSITLWVVWIAAFVGILYQYLYHERCKWLEIVLYVFIATLPSLIILEVKESSGVFELAAGGLVYLLGVIFFKSDGTIPFAHAIWHLLVIVGVCVHYYAVCVHLLGKKAVN